jgi:hypothetical protein
MVLILDNKWREQCDWRWDFLEIFYLSENSSDTFACETITWKSKW